MQLIYSLYTFEVLKLSSILNILPMCSWVLWTSSILPIKISWWPSANEVCKGYVFTPVCQSFCSQGKGSASRRGSASEGDSASRGLHPGGIRIRGAYIQGGSASRGVCIQGAGQIPHRILWGMVNERVVCILLEYILVISKKYFVMRTITKGKTVKKFIFT